MKIHLMEFTCDNQTRGLFQVNNDDMLFNVRLSVTKLRDQTVTDSDLES